MKKMKKDRKISCYCLGSYRFIALLFATMLTCGSAFSQHGNRTIFGIVKDETGEPLPGASVSIKKLKTIDAVQSVATDVNGHFQLTFPSNIREIIVSYIGYKSRIITLNNNNKYEIVLASDTRMIDEVVVTGLFTRKANTFTGAVSTLRGDDLRRLGNQNVLQSLKNLDPSFLQIENLSSGSNPNSLPEFQLRGSSTVSSIQGEYASNANQPLFILDGFETELTKILDLDMNQIESLTILKDATAKAIYGSKAANGVIVIETKRPAAGRMKVAYNGNINIETPDLSSYKLCNATEKLQVEKMAGLFTSENSESQINLDQTYSAKLREVLAGVDTDWMAQPVHTGIGQKHSINLEGGDTSMLYGVDLSYNKITGVMKGSNRSTFSGGITLSYRLKKLIFRNKLSVDYNSNNDSPWGTFDKYCQMNPYSRIYDQNGRLIKSYSYTNNKNIDANYYNPIYNSTLNCIFNNTYTNITNNFYIEYQLKENLKLTGRFGIVRKTTTEDTFKPANHTDFIDYTDAYRKGSYRKSNGVYTDINADAGVNYSAQLKKHLFFFNSQINMSNNVYSTAIMTAEGFPNDKMDDITFGVQYEKNGKPTGTEGISRSCGGLVSFNYSYDDRYLFDANYRLTGSSETGSRHRWGSFWSLGTGWNIHNESFLKHCTIINRLKLRGSFGYTGSQGFSSYDAMPTFVYYSDASYNGMIGSYVKGLANPYLKWQQKYDTNIGMDIVLWKSRINGRFDYYISDTKGMITNVTVPLTTGFSTYVANLGETENKGYEAYLNLNVLQKGRNFMNIYGSLAHNTNKLKKISNSLRAWNEKKDAKMTSLPAVKYYEGYSMNAIWAVKSLGIDPQNGKEIYLKKDGSVTYTYNTADQIVCGDTQPKFNGNIGANGEFKGFGFSITANYRWGGQIYNQTLVDKVENAQLQYNVDRRVFTDRWQKTGDNARFKAITDQTTTYPTSRFVEDYNTFTLSSLSVYYDFYNCTFMKKCFLERLKVAIYTNDLFVISSVKTERGTSYPFARTFSLSVQATF